MDTGTMKGMTIAELERMTGRTYRTIIKRLSSLNPIRHDEKSAFYDPREALPLIYSDEPQRTRGFDIKKERARLAARQADKLEIEIRRMLFTLVSAADVGREWENRTKAFSTKMLALPPRLSLQLAAVTDVVTIRSLLEKAIHEAIDELRANVSSQVSEPGDSTRTEAPSEAYDQ